MSPEMIAIVLSAVGLVAATVASMFSGLTWVVRRIDALDTKLTDRIDAVDAKLTERIDTVDAKLTERIDTVETKLTARLDTVETRLTDRVDAVGNGLSEVKVSIARLEGPRPRLIVGR
ncbi:hypothetical protein J2Y69_000211 [Microbacterium resistens]|uniref:DUF2746 domain-containing protein n=1 Tax=Microbacterium resistens TaxID=156977 RepID=A0ABU1S7N6_9MICO|nr:hypothetical protein [Microbacterium resistens]MDR6865629.1 hypothetical protein [Microbacterium resistens]